MRKNLKRKTDKLNKITSTQDKIQEKRRMSITIMEDPLTDKNNKEKKIQDILEPTESEENLSNAIKETENLRNKLKEKEEDYNKNNIINDKELLLINQNIKEKSEKLEKVSKGTKVLLYKLNLLNSQINEEYNKAKILQAANKIRIDYLKDLKLKNKKRVNQGKKIILLNNNIIEKYKIQKEKLEKIIEEDKNLKINDYTKKLNELIKYKNDLTKEIENLRIMKNNHEKCINLNVELVKILERIKNEYNSEYKSKNNKNNFQYKRKNTLSNYPLNSLPKIINNVNILTSPSKLNKPEFENQKNVNKEKLNPKNSKSMKNLFDSDYFLQKDLKKIKEQVRNEVKIKLNQNIKRYISSYTEEKKKNNIKEYKNLEKKSLFSKLENEMLSKIIPKECLQKYQDKFKTIDDETFHIKNELNKNEKKKKINKEKILLLFITEKKDNNLTKKNIELNSKISIIKGKNNTIIKDLKKIQKEFNNINEKYNNKKEENDIIKNHWNEFSNDIKNKKIAIKNGEKIEKKELDILNKWGNNAFISFNKKLSDEEACDDNIQKIKKK